MKLNPEIIQPQRTRDPDQSDALASASFSFLSNIQNLSLEQTSSHSSSSSLLDNSLKSPSSTTSLDSIEHTSFGHELLASVRNTLAEQEYSLIRKQLNALQVALTHDQCCHEFLNLLQHIPHEVKNLEPNSKVMFVSHIAERKSELLNLIKAQELIIGLAQQLAAEPQNPPHPLQLQQGVHLVTQGWLEYQLGQQNCIASLQSAIKLLSSVQQKCPKDNPLQHEISNHLIDAYTTLAVFLADQDKNSTNEALTSLNTARIQLACQNKHNEIQSHLKELDLLLKNHALQYEVDLASGKTANFTHQTYAKMKKLFLNTQARLKLLPPSLEQFRLHLALAYLCAEIAVRRPTLNKMSSSSHFGLKNAIAIYSQADDKIWAHFLDKKQAFPSQTFANEYREIKNLGQSTFKTLMKNHYVSRPMNLRLCQFDSAGSKNTVYGIDQSGSNKKLPLAEMWDQQYAGPSGAIPIC